MLSAQVSPGDTATASQYNNLRGDTISAGYYPINGVDNDSTFPVDAIIVGDAEVVRFLSTGSSISYFDVQIPPFIDTGEDWELRIGFDMDTAQAANVVLELMYASVSGGEDSSPALTVLTETITVPVTADTYELKTLSTIQIPQADLADGDLVTFRLSRLGGDVSDTHGGRLRLFNLQLIQIQT